MDTSSREPWTIGVVGAGVMGTGIAHTVALGGSRCLVWGRRQERAEEALRRAERKLVRAALRRGMTREAAGRLGEHVVPVRTLDDMGAADLVIETVIEDPDVKRDVLGRIDACCSPGAVLATNTSSLPLATLAPALSAHSERFLGTHFFYPAPHRPLCELQPAPAAGPAVLGRAREILTGLGVRCVVIDGSVAGSVASRLFGVLMAEAMRLRDQGAATAADIDLLCEQGLGHTLGPLAAADRIGRDTVLRALRHGGLHP
ncbi:3-hydroxyacyl-CoA dehydrogenase family protein [Streptomyces stramineus]|uniref:3-hydroxyacyl-CoA dehydrogenase family protein n=1 Tax=Streptomyces stramineus TaxID=173861 RepID=A0ABP3J5V5_9ACTN